MTEELLGRMAFERNHGAFRMAIVLNRQNRGLDNIANVPYISVRSWAELWLRQLQFKRA